MTLSVVGVVEDRRLLMEFKRYCSIDHALQLLLWSLLQEMALTMSRLKVSLCVPSWVMNDRTSLVEFLRVSLSYWSCLTTFVNGSPPRNGIGNLQSLCPPSWVVVVLSQRTGLDSFTDHPSYQLWKNLVPDLYWPLTCAWAHTHIHWITFSFYIQLSTP